MFWKKEKIPEITCQELHDTLAAKKEIILVDVRNEFELEYGQISKEQILIPLPELAQKISELEKYKEQELVVYCRTGGRSARATAFLQSQGFTGAKNLVGGILAYREFDESIITY